MKARVLTVGINHRTCPLDVRENYAVSGQDLHDVLNNASQIAGIEGVVVLSTCNRTEFYCLADEKQDIDPMALFMLIERIRHSNTLKPQMLYTLSNEAAIRHLFRVTAGLDSMVLGEPQITGQVKQALAEARRAQTVAPTLGRLFEYAFKTAKEVRTQTGIGRGAVSVGYVALELARKIFGNLSKTSMLLIGAGEIAEAAAKNLAKGGVRDCVVTNRTYSRAVEVAEKFDWRAEPFEKLDDLLVKTDIAVIAIGTGKYILDRNRIKLAMRQRRYRYLFLVDMGVPRAVDPSVREEETVFLYDIDDVEEIIHEHIEQRREFAQEAEAMVEQRIHAGMAIVTQTDSAQLIGALARYIEKIRQQEVEKALNALKNQPPDKVLNAMTRSMINKVFHPLFTELKTEQDPAVAGVVSKVFFAPKNGKSTQKDRKDGNKDSHQNQ